MDITWDPAQAAANIAEGGIDFETARRAVIAPDCVADLYMITKRREEWRVIGWSEGFGGVAATVSVTRDPPYRVAIHWARRASDLEMLLAFPDQPERLSGQLLDSETDLSPIAGITYLSPRTVVGRFCR